MTTSRAALCGRMHTFLFDNTDVTSAWKISGSFSLTLESKQSTQTDNVSEAHDMAPPLLKERVHARGWGWYAGCFVET